MSELARRWWRGELGVAGSALDVVMAPAEVVYRVATSLRNRAYDLGLLRTRDPALPVISIGNIAVGGSGKTPFTSWLAQRMAARGARPAIVHGGYADDEPELHRMWTPQIPVIVDRDRVRAARTATQAGATVVLLDDAFQHRRIRRDVDIVLVSVERWADRVRLLPRGPWREPAAALRRADIVVCVRRTATLAEARRTAASLSAFSTKSIVLVQLRASGWLHDAAPSQPPRGEAVLVAGVAEPSLVEANARAAGANVRDVLTFPDHHAYTTSDVHRIDVVRGTRPVVTTAKDWVKLRTLFPPGDVWVLTQDVVIDEGVEQLDAALAQVQP